MTDTQTQTQTPLVSGPLLDDLAELLHRPGPFATLVTAIEPRGEDNVDERRLRWREFGNALEDKGAPETCISVLEEEFMAPPYERRGLAVVADEEGLLLTMRHLEEPRASFARWEPLPSLAQIIEWRQVTPAHLAVVADRTGADIYVATPEGARVELHTEGDHDEIHKPNAGGWSHRRFQQRAEDSWEHNAADVAHRVHALAHAANARLVMVAGDSHAVSLLTQALPDETARRTTTLDHGSRDAGIDSIGEDVIHLVATVAAEDTVAFLDSWRQEHGRDERATDGPWETAQALAAAQVGVLGLHDDPTDERAAWFGPEPTDIAMTEEALLDLQVGAPGRTRLADVFVRSALLTGAQVRIIPGHGGPAEGIGALLRWS